PRDQIVVARELGAKKLESDFVAELRAQRRNDVADVADADELANLVLSSDDVSRPKGHREGLLQRRLWGLAGHSESWGVIESRTSGNAASTLLVASVITTLGRVLHTRRCFPQPDGFDGQPAFARLAHIKCPANVRRDRVYCVSPVTVRRISDARFATVPFWD